MYNIKLLCITKQKVQHLHYGSVNGGTINHHKLLFFEREFGDVLLHLLHCVILS